VATLGVTVAYLVVRPDCPLEGLAGPRLKYVPFSSLYDVVAAAQCGRLELHVPGVYLLRLQRLGYGLYGFSLDLLSPAHSLGGWLG